MSVSERRVLRLKTMMSFGGLMLVPGDYVGDSIPTELEDEFKSGSQHVEEVLTRLPADEKVTKQKRNKGPDTKQATGQLGNSVDTSEGASDEVKKVDQDTSSLKGETDTKEGDVDDPEAAAAEAAMAAQIDPAKDEF